ncbi:Uncharacterized protein APZ42_019637 [Daphnia magna]|uniref:Uncharacterized protein n=1 Tax=Daphnia magna TaxID=35525 RepID=A0A164YAQ1_9CRUS|nr:Uncharacterized protein APZ42_019637 [Daphnia magna]
MCLSSLVGLAQGNKHHRIFGDSQTLNLYLTDDTPEDDIKYYFI